DFVQVNYSLAEPEAEHHLLRIAAHSGTAVIANRPFAGGAAIRQIKRKHFAVWGKKAGDASCGQILLKWTLGPLAITCVIPATRNPDHMTDDLEAATGALPDEALRRRMTAHWTSL